MADLTLPKSRQKENHFTDTRGETHILILVGNLYKNIYIYIYCEFISKLPKKRNFNSKTAHILKSFGHLVGTKRIVQF